MPYSVYISSTSEFREIRQKIFSEIREREKLYEVKGMEDYTAEDLPAVTRCRRDVANCDIYVCIWGHKYGTVVNDGKGLSFTHHEFEEASERKIQRLIFLKIFPPGKDSPDDHENLKQLKDKISNQDQLLTQKFEEEENLPALILKALDNYVASFKEEIEKRKQEREDRVRNNVNNYNKLFFCNREEINQEFVASLDEDPIQFFLLNGHENDLPDYFVQRAELEHIARGIQWRTIKIRPLIPEAASDFSKAEVHIKNALLNKLQWRKFRLPKDVSPESMIEYMTENNIDYLSIAWYIESVLWKNDKLREFVVSFYEKYKEVNAALNTDKRILFFGILRYAEKSRISQKEFHERVKSIQWENNLQKFKRITRDDIKNWLRDYDIEFLNSNSEELIRLYLPGLLQREMFYSEVEDGLKKILDRYNQ